MPGIEKGDIEWVGIKESNVFIENGILSISWDKYDAFDAEEELLFTVDLPGSMHAIDMDDALTAEAYLSDNKIVPIELFLDKHLDENFLIQSVSPNPFSDVTILSYRGFDKENLTIDIYNSVGEIVDKLWIEKPHKEGKITIKRNGLTSGLYFIRIKEYPSVSQKILIVD